VIELIGRGGMGSVYLAEDRELDRQVAVKVLTAASADAGMAERLRQEARILARLEHPGIVPIHDVGTLPDGRLYYVMKRIRGVRLDEFVRRGAGLGDKLRIFERVCDAVAFAHAHGIVHRDLKPENIMVGEFGEMLVLDWGVAKLLQPTEVAPDSPTSLEESTDPPRGGRTLHGTVLGTPGYMAPEQARGDVDRIDARTDVFALGAMLQVVLGASPGADTAGQAPRWPATVPRRLRAVCLKAQAADPAARYMDASSLAADIARFRAGLPVEAHREGALERLARFALRYRVPILLVLAYLVMRALLVWFTR
jgi:serine/threonine protein kinase